tara:strand:- start:74 stop:271 length:198 start_codon:yes stop_codon:yes gene_type:complete
MALRAYQRWSDDDDDLLIFMLGIPCEVDQIMRVHGRSEGSIRSRIMHLFKKGVIQIEPMEDDEYV